MNTSPAPPEQSSEGHPIGNGKQVVAIQAQGVAVTGEVH